MDQEVTINILSVLQRILFFFTEFLNLCTIALHLELLQHDSYFFAPPSLLSLPCLFACFYRSETIEYSNPRLSILMEGITIINMPANDFF